MSAFSTYFGPRSRKLLIGCALLAIGGGIGSAITHAAQRPMVMAPVSPVKIASLSTMSQPWFGEPVVSVRGRVAEAFGGKIVLDDGSGRALIDLGRDVGQASPVALNQVLTVQGRFDDGELHAGFVVGPDGRVAALRPHHGDHRRDHRPKDGRRQGPPAPEAGPVAPRDVVLDPGQPGGKVEK